MLDVFRVLRERGSGSRRRSPHLGAAVPSPKKLGLWNTLGLFLICLPGSCKTVHYEAARGGAGNMSGHAGSIQGSAGQNPSSDSGGGTGANATFGGASGGPGLTGGQQSGGATGGTESCPEESSLVFELSADNPDRYCTPGCEGEWLSMKDSQGHELSLEKICGVACDSCQQKACAPTSCPPPQPLTGVLEQAFTGEYSVVDTCGENQECTRTECLPRGTYEAQLCLERRAVNGPSSEGCEGTGELDCINETFEWPSTSRVRGRLN